MFAFGVWVFSLFSFDSQWHQIFQMSEGLRTSRLDPGQLEILTNQVLLCTAVLFVHCLRVYSEAVESHSGSGILHPFTFVHYSPIKSTVMSLFRGF